MRFPWNRIFALAVLLIGLGIALRIFFLGVYYSGLLDAISIGGAFLFLAWYALESEPDERERDQ